MASPTEEIKVKTDIVALVSETVPLKRAGRNFSANCPFHNERTPSFFIFPDRQTWHCFGACATGGDAFSFVMRRDGVPFGEALRTLADRAGVTLPSPHASREKARVEERLKALNRAAAMFFHSQLLTSPEASAAQAHLEKRGLDEAVIEEFRLGYCPASREALEQRLRTEDFSQQEIELSGLLRRREDGSPYCLFRSRLMVPIFDERSDYIGFGARTLDDSGPKYINSPQSPIFEKGSVLYGIHRARDVIRAEGQAVIVEGYMDVLTAHQHGFRNVVASMGTALTERQVATLTRLASRFILALDPDAAGDEATLRSLEGSWRVVDRPKAPGQPVGFSTRETRPPLELRVMDLPRGRDPDEIIKEDPATWERLLATATPVIDYVFRSVAARFDSSTAHGKAAITQRLAPFIFNAPNVFELNDRIRKLAHLMKEEENIVRSAVEGFRSPGIGRRPRKASPPTSPQLFGEAPRDSVEEYCLAVLLRYPELRVKVVGLQPQHFLKAQNREIFAQLAKGVRTEELKEHVDEAVHEQVDALLSFRLEAVPHWEREEGLESCVPRLAKRLVQLEMEAVQSQYAEGMLTIEEASGKMEELKTELSVIDQKAP